MGRALCHPHHDGEGLSGIPRMSQALDSGGSHYWQARGGAAQSEPGGFLSLYELLPEVLPHVRHVYFQKLEENDDDSCLNSPWADNTALKRHFHGVKDIKWRPR